MARKLSASMRTREELASLIEGRLALNRSRYSQSMRSPRRCSLAQSEASTADEMRLRLTRFTCGNGRFQ